MIKEKVLNTIKKYNMIDKNDKKILVAVSGGFDSTCLLHVLNDIKEEFGYSLCIAHINHCLRDNAILDEQYVIDLGKELDIPVFVKKADIEKISKEEKISLETAGRNVRNEFFEEIAKKENCSKIALAHNANDNAETVLLNMFRGTGLTGLRGIRKVRDEKYIRPIIEITRKEIEQYLNEKGIEARLDESNLTDEYRRNKIRNVIIPYIEENFNDNIVNTINRMSDLVIQDDDYIVKVVQEEFNKNVIKKETNNIVINGKNISKLEINIQKRLIIKCIEELFGNTMQIEQIHINDIVKLNKRNIGNKYLLVNKHLKVYFNKGKLHFEKID